MLDSATAAYIDRVRALGAAPLHELDPAEAREMGRRVMAQFEPGPEVLSSCDVEVATAADELVTVRVLVPTVEPIGVLLYLHGGGWVMGGLEQSDPLARTLAVGTSCTVVVVDYRLAPEHPYPAGLNDCVAALAWTRAERQMLCGDPEAPVVVLGDSSGGNLAVATLLRSRDAGELAADLQVLVYPVVAPDFGSDSYEDPTNELILTRAAMQAYWGHYVAPEHREEPYVAPMRAETLAGLPSSLVITAEHDVLRDEGEALAAALSGAGVPTELIRWPGQMHGFFAMVGVLPSAAESQSQVCHWVRQQVADLPKRWR